MEVTLQADVNRSRQQQSGHPVLLIVVGHVDCFPLSSLSHPSWRRRRYTRFKIQLILPAHRKHHAYRSGLRLPFAGRCFAYQLTANSIFTLAISQPCEQFASCADFDEKQHMLYSGYVAGSIGPLRIYCFIEYPNEMQNSRGFSNCFTGLIELHRIQLRTF